MPAATVNGVRLAYEITGTGTVPLVLVHGSWVSRRSWDLVLPGFGQTCRVLSYDRRGHSESERPAKQGSVHEDVADLAALIDHAGLAPAWVVGNSFGGSIALRLAGTRPDLVRGVMVHEPPLLSVLQGDPAAAPILQAVGAKVPAIIQRIAAGDHAGAAEQFMETVALGPGAWAGLPHAIKETCIENAPTFLDEANDPDQFGFDPSGLHAWPRPVLLSRGDQSSPMFHAVVGKLAKMLPRAEVLTLSGAGHAPNVTHPEVYIDAIMNFIRRHVVS